MRKKTLAAALTLLFASMWFAACTSDGGADADVGAGPDLAAGDVGYIGADRVVARRANCPNTK